MQNAVQLKRDVLAELQWKPSAHSARIGVTARDGVIALTGHVTTFGKKRAAGHLTRLTTRQREVMDRVRASEASKNLAADLGIGQRTAEAHRAAVTHRTGVNSLPKLTDLSLFAAASGAGGTPS